jgi:hypothetical protein
MRYLVLILCAFCLGGCVSFHEPGVRVTGVRQVEATDVGGRFEVALELSNEGEVPLPLPEASYRFAVRGVEDFAYIDLPALVLGPGAVQPLVLPAAIATDGQPLAGADWSVRGHIVYAPESPLRTFLTETGFPLPRANFSDRGTVE